MISDHRLADERSVELHRAVADRLRAAPDLLDPVRARLAAWRADGKIAAPYADAWDEILSLPLEEVCAFLVDEGERATTLRQSTPFTGILDAATRWRIWRAVRARRGEET